MRICMRQVSVLFFALFLVLIEGRPIGHNLPHQRLSIICFVRRRKVQDRHASAESGLLDQFFLAFHEVHLLKTIITKANLWVFGFRESLPKLRTLKIHRAVPDFVGGFHRDETVRLFNRWGAFLAGSYQPHRELNSMDYYDLHLTLSTACLAVKVKGLELAGQGTSQFLNIPLPSGPRC